MKKEQNATQESTSSMTLIMKSLKDTQTWELIKMKTIKVSEKIWAKLMKARINLRCQSIDQVIDRLFALIQKFKLGVELKEIKK